MTHHLFAATVLLSLVLVAAPACGGSGTSSTTRTPSTATGSVASAAPSTAAATAGETVVARATDQATLQQFGDLRRFVLADADVPFGFRVRSAQPIRRDDIVTAQLGIPTLGAFLRASDLEGAWAALYSREQPTSGLSSIAYRFGSAAGTVGFIAAIAGLKSTDYPAATSIEPIDAASIGDASKFMRYHIPGGRTLEYTWAQGRLAGQIILRYSGDIESPDDIALIISLAQKESDKMRASPSP